MRLYGEKITFDVLREGSKVGHHTVTFARASEEELTVTARFDLTVTFLTIPLYEFRYRSTAIWRDGRLTDLVATIDDDGEKTTVRALTKGGTLSISGANGPAEWSVPLYPTNHWNAGVLSQSHVLNTLNGDISRVRIESQGRERIQAEGQWVEATRYQYSGDIDTTVWYDDRGRWVKMRFPAKSGSIIEYVCTRCGQTKAVKAASN